MRAAAASHHSLGLCLESTNGGERGIGYGLRGGKENWPLSSLHQGSLLYPELSSAPLLVEINTKTILMYLLCTCKGLDLHVCDLNPWSGEFFVCNIQKMRHRGAGRRVGSRWD